MHIDYKTYKEDEIKTARNTIENLYMNLKDKKEFFPLTLGMELTNLADENPVEQKSDAFLKVEKEMDPEKFKMALYGWTQEAFNDCILDTPFIDNVEASEDKDIYGIIVVNSPLIENKIQLYFNKIEDI